MMATRFLLVAFIGELAVQVDVRQAALDLAWIPRLHNLDSDEFPSNLLRRLNPDKDITVHISNMVFQILSLMLEVGVPLYESIEKAKEARKADASKPSADRMGRKRPSEQRLRR